MSRIKITAQGIEGEVNVRSLCPVCGSPDDEVLYVYVSSGDVVRGCRECFDWSECPEGATNQLGELGDRIQELLTSNSMLMDR